MAQIEIILPAMGEGIIEAEAPAADSALASGQHSGVLQTSERQRLVEFGSCVDDSGDGPTARRYIAGAKAAVDGKMEIDALVAYLQQLGTLLQSRR